MMFHGGLARSGVVVLPCGAGKTLTGIAACARIKKTCLVLCTSNVAAEQWCEEFLKWSTIDAGAITCFTGQSREFARFADITVTTYSMLSYSGPRGAATQRVMQMIAARAWGMVILDEVHVVPAATFRRVCGSIKAQCKLGLTATPVREDGKITDLDCLVGPVLYQADWVELQDEGYIASVQCFEVHCPMTIDYRREHEFADDNNAKILLAAMNPHKIQACEWLINQHEARGDKIIVFSDNLFALKHYARRLCKPYICGETEAQELHNVLDHFKHNPAVMTVFMSKIGDTSIDVPEASVVIQISSHFASRRQEAQRLGRILRRKANGGDAYFYTLLSRGTKEMDYAPKRQQFLREQGYTYTTVEELPGLPEGFSDSERQMQLVMLRRCLAHSKPARKVPLPARSVKIAATAAAPARSIFDAPVQLRAKVFAERYGGW